MKTIDTEDVKCSVRLSSTVPESLLCDREVLARNVVCLVQVVGDQLRDLEPMIRRLWAEFEALKTGETILGCTTKKQFCEERLRRTPRAIQYLLAGGNHNRSETVSLPPKGTPCKCPDCPETFESISDGLKHGKKEHGVSIEQIAEFKRMLLGRPKPVPAPTPKPAPAPAVSPQDRQESHGQAATGGNFRKLERTTAAPATASETLTESFYVIRRKSDGAFLNCNGTSGMFGEFSLARKYDEIDEDRFDLLYQTARGARTSKLQRDEWEWVRVEASYGLTKISASAASDNACDARNAGAV
jgi:hypothetical protein